MAATLTFFYLGVLTPDGVAQYEQVMAGSASDAKPPLFVHVWRVTDPVVCGSGGIFALHVTVHWAGALAIALAVARGAVARGILVLALGLLPPIAGRLPVVSVDGALVASWLLAVGLMLHRDGPGPRRTALTAAAFLLLTYGTLLRYNVLLAALPLFWWLAAPAESEGLAQPRACRRRAAVTLALAAGVAVGAQALNRFTAEPTRLWTSPMLWDLAAISMRSGELVLPSYVLGGGEASADLASLAAVYGEWSVDPLLWREDPLVVVPGDAASARRLVGDWMSAIAEHPAAYARHRGLTARRLLTVDGVPQNAVFPAESVASPKLESCRGALPVRFESSAATRRISRGLRSLTRTPLYATWLWALVAVAIAVSGRWVDGRRPREARALAWSAILYVAPLAVVVPAVEFRYTLWLYGAVAVALVLITSSRIRPRAETP